MDAEDKNYFLGTEDEELLRLGYQHRIWAVECNDFLRKAGFTFNHKILDLGCGPGFVSMELAQMVGPLGSVISLDRSQKYIDYLDKQIKNSFIKNIITKQGNLNEVEFPASSFDGIYSRFVFLFLSHPKEVISKCYRFLKKGGVFAVTDFAAYSPHFLISPHSNLFYKVIDNIEKSFVFYKANLKVQLQLPQLMTECGFEVKNIEPVVRVARPKDLLWNWPPLFFKSYIPKLLEMNLLKKSDEKQFWKDWYQRSQDPNAFFITPPILNIIGIKV